MFCHWVGPSILNNGRAFRCGYAPTKGVFPLFGGNVLHHPTPIVLQVAHIRLKKASRRLDGVQRLIEHLEGDKARGPWLDLSPKGIITLRSSKTQVAELASRIHETWLRQLELRELFKFALACCEPNQVRFEIFIAEMYT